MQSFLVSFAIQRRVLVALFMREIHTRWGRRNLGFAWVFAEPLVFVFPVLTMWSYIRAPVVGGVPEWPFVWSGYLPLLIFRHVGGQALYVLRNNAAVLYHRSVTPLDLFLGRCGFEALGNLAATATSFLVLYVSGLVPWPYNPAELIAGFMLMTWWALAIGMILAATCERSDIVEHIWFPASYMYIMLSGFPFLADWLPPGLRQLALAIDPPLHGYEIIRAGLFGNLVRTYGDPLYLSCILATLTLIGLWLMRHVRQHLEIL